MKKLYALLLVGAACTMTTSAQISELQGKKIASVGDPVSATSIQANTWYVLKNVGRNAYVESKANNSAMMMQSANVTVGGLAAADVNARLLVRFVTTKQKGQTNTEKDAYYIQNGYGSYFKTLTQGGNNGATANQNEAAPYTYNAINESSVSFMEESTPKTMDGNAAGGTLAGWNTGYSTNPNGNSSYQVLPVNLVDVTTYTVTINHVLNGNIFKTETQPVIEGTEFNTITITPLVRYGYTSATTGNEGTVNTDKTVTITYTPNSAEPLPFETSTAGVFDAGTKWYKLGIARPTPKVVSYDKSTGKAVTAVTSETTMSKFFFAISGDNLSGFKIYNKEAGTDKVLWSAIPQNNAKIPFVNASEVAGGFTLVKNENGGYVFLNTANANGYVNDVNGELGYWVDANAKTDAGSTFIFTPVTQEDLNAVATADLNAAKAAFNAAKAAAQPYVDTYAGKTNQLGTPTTESYNTLTGATTATPEETVAAYEAATQAVNNAVAALQLYIPNGIYSLFTAGRENAYMATSNNVGSASANIDGAHKLWKIETVTGGFTMQNLGTGKYLSQPGNGNGVAAAMSETPQTILGSVSDTPGVVFLGGSQSLQLFHADAAGKLVGWSRDGAASKWTINPVDGIDVTLNADFEGWGTFSAPFATTIPSGVQAYSVAIEGEQAKLNAVTGIIPANSAVVIKATAGATVKFAKSEAEGTALANNALKPALIVEATPAAGEGNNIYTLQKNDSFVGFYPFNGTQVVGFKGYLIHTAPASGGVQGFSLNLDTVTGISLSTEDAETKTVFDLSGRRISNAKGGLYIVNGKKVLVK